MRDRSYLTVIIFYNSSNMKKKFTGGTRRSAGLVSSLVMYGTSLLPRQAGSLSHTAGCGTSGTYVARFTCQLSHSLFPSISLDLLHSEMGWSVFRVCLTSALYLLHLSSLFWLRFYLVEILLLLLHKTAHMCPSLLPKDPNP